jgi:hypothetical protein
MQKARFLIHGASAAAVIEKAAPKDRAPWVNLLARAREYLLPDAVALLRDELADVTMLESRIHGEAGYLAKLVERIGIANPYRWLSPGAKGRWRQSRRAPAPGFILPFAADPAAVGIKADRITEARIGFADDGAPTQQHRGPVEHGGASFLRRQDALRAIARRPRERVTVVNVVVVDQGMMPAYVDGLGGTGSYQGVLWDSSAPGPMPSELPTEQRHRYRTWPQWHAHMIVRNIFAVAQDNRPLDGSITPIKIYDVPVVPDRVSSVTSTADAMALRYEAIREAIRQSPGSERWVIVNAWGIKNRLREAPLGAITEGAELHSLNGIIGHLAGNPRVAVVFAAGNNGLFSPDPEVGPYDRGPRRSIWQPATLTGVWTAAACDATGMWIGASSQGPQGSSDAGDQPDFCLPSYFREDLDAHVANTGSSASCGLLAGLIVEEWRNDPAHLNKLIAKTKTRRHGHRDHSRRQGSGVPQAGGLR